MGFPQTEEDENVTKTSTFPLWRPVFLKAAPERLRKEDGVSINQHVVRAVAEKVSSMRCALFGRTPRDWGSQSIPANTEPEEWRAAAPGRRDSATIV